MSQNFNIVSANLCGMFIGLCLWGFYICLFVVTMWTLKKTKARFNYAIAALVIIFILNVVTTVVDSIKIYEAFITNAGDTFEYFAKRRSGILFALDDAIFFPASVTADTILWWRLYVIWSRDCRVLILPSLALIFAFVGGIINVNYDVKMGMHGPLPRYIDPYMRWAEILLATELVTNWVVTLLIAAKLWVVGYHSEGRTPSGYLRVILALVESGALFSMTMGAFIILWGTNHMDWANLLGYSLTRIVGIVPVLIILQLSLGYTHASDTIEDSAINTIAVFGQTYTLSSTRFSGPDESRGRTIDMLAPVADKGRATFERSTYTSRRLTAGDQQMHENVCIGAVIPASSGLQDV